jgi:hypothetical protein
MMNAQVQASAELAAHRTRGDFANYGEYLYIEGLSDLEKRRQRMVRMAREKEAAEVEGLTFKPQISEKARQLKAASRVPAWKRLAAHRQNYRAQHKQNIHRENAQEAELAECTFRPKVGCLCRLCFGGFVVPDCHGSVAVQIMIQLRPSCMSKIPFESTAKAEHSP